MKTTKWLKAACAAMAIAAAVPSIALAGRQQLTAFCWRDSTGAGYCYGSFLGFRTSANANDYAQFVTNGSYRAFYASAGGVTVSCVPNATISAFWDQAMANQSYFFIEYDNLGYCTYLSLANSSADANY